MHLIHFRLTAACLFLATLTVRAEEPPLSDLLRDGLYAEEVARDSEAAAKTYEQVLARYSGQRAFAASALFRLAEVRRKQDRKDDAIQLYQRLLAEFSDAATEAKLARESLTALGGKTPEAQAERMDLEADELLRLEQLAKASPDLLRKPEVIIQAVTNGWPRPVAFILDAVSSKENEHLAMVNAARTGHLSIVKLLLARGFDPKGDSAVGALNRAVEAGNREIVTTLLAAGTSPDGKLADAVPDHETPLVIATRQNHLELARLLIDAGADVNLMPARCKPWLEGSPPFHIGGPLHEAICFDRPQIVELLLQHHADVNLMEPVSKITPVWLVALKASGADPQLLKRLLALGADPDVETAPQDPQLTPPPGYPGESTALERAVLNGSVDLLKLMLEAKKALNSPVDPMLLRNVSLSSDASTALETTRLLLDHGADPNPPDPMYQSLIKLWDKGHPMTKPKEKSLIQEVLSTSRIHQSRQNEQPEDLWSLVELLLERGSKVNSEWVSEGFPGAHADVRPFLIRRFLYPGWAGEKAIWVIDLDFVSPDSKPKIAAKADEEPPVLEQWMLEEEEKSLRNFQKDFPEFALYRKTDRGVTEIARFRLNSPEPFPKLQWGDVLEERGREGRGFSTRPLWNGNVKEALEKKVKASQPAPAPSPR